MFDAILKRKVNSAIVVKFVIFRGVNTFVFLFLFLLVIICQEINTKLKHAGPKPFLKGPIFARLNTHPLFIDVSFFGVAPAHKSHPACHLVVTTSKLKT